MERLPERKGGAESEVPTLWTLSWTTIATMNGLRMFCDAVAEADIIVGTVT